MTANGIKGFRSWWLALCLLAVLPGAWGQVASVKLDDQVFPGTIQLAGSELQINGAGFRAVAWFKGYAAALYLTRRSSTPAGVQAAPGPKRLQMRMLVDVDAEEFVKAFDKGVTRNTPPAELPKLAERMAQFGVQVRALGKVAKRDVVDLDFLPGRGLQMSVNGKSRGEPIPGEDLYSACLRIFVGDKPVDTALRSGLLGGNLRRP